MATVPSDYARDQGETPFCASLYGIKYLEDLRDSAFVQSTPESQSTLITFCNSTAKDQIDSMFIAKDVKYRSDIKKFALSGQFRDLGWTERRIQLRPRPDDFARYMYDTGPGPVFKQAILMDRDLSLEPEELESPKSFTILVKREGEGNIWHCLMEIMSLTMTIDVLKMTIDPETKKPFLSDEDAENTQVVILDDKDEGPFFSMWQMFARKPVLRLGEIENRSGLTNVIVPLAGGGNPFWSGTWKVHPCGRSDLIRVFSQRVYEHFGINYQKERESEVVVTFIDRTQTRKLVDQDAILEALTLQNLKIDLRAVDLASLSFPEQIKVIRATDVLVGVHGAGMTHAMFLKEGSAVVEILPAEVFHKGFRNLAVMMGHTYLSMHAKENIKDDDDVFRDWHGDNMRIDQSKFLEAVSIAVKTMYNKGWRSWDAVGPLDGGAGDG